MRNASSLYIYNVPNLPDCTDQAGQDTLMCRRCERQQPVLYLWSSPIAHSRNTGVWWTRQLLPVTVEAGRPK